LAVENPFHAKSAKINAQKAPKIASLDPQVLIKKTLGSNSDTLRETHGTQNFPKRDQHRKFSANDFATVGNWFCSNSIII
jgi:hypothetical protein